MANKVSFSLVNEPNAPLLSTTNKQTEDDYELIATEDDDRHEHHHQHHHKHIIPGESVDVNDDDEEEEIEGDEENPIVVEQIREQANMMVSNILASAIHQISIVPQEEID